MTKMKRYTVVICLLSYVVIANGESEEGVQAIQVIR
jgi:hypothetical protein